MQSCVVSCMRRLVHAGSERRAGVDVKHQRGLLIGDLRLLPGWDRQNVLDPELVKILLPVVDPVQVLGLLDRDRSLSDIAIGSELRQLLLDRGLDLLRGLQLAVHKDMAVLRLLQEETEYRRPVILSRFGQDVDEHLLLLRRCKRHVILDLRAVQPYVLHRTDQNIFRIHFRAHSETHPLHT